MHPDTATPLAEALRRAASGPEGPAPDHGSLLAADPRLHELLDRTLDAVVLVDAGGTIVSCNGPARAVFGDLGPGVPLDRVWGGVADGERVVGAIRQAVGEGAWTGTLAVAGSDARLRHGLFGHRSPDGRLIALTVAADTTGDHEDRTFCGLTPGLSPLTELVDHAAGAARAVAAVHRHGLVHRGLTARSFVLGEVPGACWIGGITGAGVVGPAQGPAPVPPLPADELPYASPERTGRVNRSLDQRSDLYSLGIVLYRLFTDMLPLTASDPLEWVHAHVARVPPTMRERRPELPQALDEIVMRLLAKDPEDRYQSAAGLLADLEHCRTELATSGAIRPFDLGARDVSDVFQVPQRLYGRHEQLALLRGALGRVTASGEAELALIEGPPGIGKSTLVQGLREAAALDHGLFVAGAFAEGGGTPYAPFADAIAELADGSLALPPAQLTALQEALATAVGDHGSVIVELAPAAARLLGDLPPAPPLPLAAAQPRAHRVIGDFLGVFAAARPLVLVLDDLHWADEASLTLVRDLVAHPAAGRLLLVGTERGSADRRRTPIDPALAATHLVLEPLTHGELTDLLADTLGRTADDCAPLATTVIEKTGGSPYFVHQFLHALHAGGVLRPGRSGGGWDWDADEIAAMTVTDNVVELMAERLRALPASTRSVLATAALLGDRFDRRTLGIATGHGERAVEPDLWDAMRERLVLARGLGFRFSHDRVRQAAYDLVPEADRPARHLAIGRRLEAEGDDTGEEIFALTAQLAAGRDAVADPAERLRYAGLELQAGRRAMAAAAFDTAATHLAEGLAFLPVDAWEREFRLAFDLRIERARCEHLGGAIAIAEALADELIEQATEPLDIAAAHALRAELHLARGEPGAAVAAGLSGWARLGVDLPADPDPADVDAAAEVVWQLLGDQPLESMLELPPLTDQAVLGGTVVFGPTLTAAFLAERHELAILLLVESARSTLVHGTTPASPLLLALFGSVLAARFGRYDEGRRLGNAAYARIDQGGILPLAAQTAVYVGNTTSWTDPYSACLPFFRAGLESGIRAGDLAHAGFCALFSAVVQYAGGVPLEELARELEPLLAFADGMGLPENRDALLIVERSAASLRGLTTALGEFGAADFDGPAYATRMATERPPFYQAILAIHQGSVDVIGRRIEEGLATADRFDELAGALAYHTLLAEAEPWFGLARAAAWDSAGPAERTRLRERISQAALQTGIWARHSPANSASRHALLEAELARIDGRHDEAAAHYEAAIAAATEHGVRHHEALARELAGRFYLGRGLRAVGVACLRDARAGYARWGAGGKVAQLDAEFDGLAPADEGSDHAGRPSQDLEMLAVVRGSQAISGELDVDQLPATLLRIAVAAAGAQVGRLVQVTPEGATVIALAEVDHETVHVTLPEGEQPDDTPRSVVDYVVRTGERLLLRDARTDPVFGVDPAIASRGVRSLLGQPIVRNGAVVGLLLLEHTLVSDAFTAQRLTAVEILATQAAISVETARLYHEVREENRVRRRTEDELRASEEQFRSLVESAPDAILITDPAGRIVLVNSRAEQLFGLGRRGLIGVPGIEVLPDIDWTGSAAPTVASSALEVERWALRGEGAALPVEVTLSPLERPEGRWTIGMVRDVTERKRLEHELEQAADHDALTGLLNRASLERELTAAIENVERSRTVAVLLVLDLDRIRDINDSLGPQAGDELIRGVAKAIGERVRPTDTVARLDGDEFALILNRTDLDGAHTLATELLTLVRDHTLEFEGGRVRTTASVGIAPIVAGNATAQSLLAAADVALNQAKEEGRDRSATYTPDSHRRAAERHTWSERIRQALDHDRFTLHAQPILDLQAGRATHSELLIRMRDGDTLIAPGEFLPTAERTGSITSIDRWVIREAVTLAARGGAGLLELNLSARSLADLELPDYVEAELERTGADPASLIFEITETAAIANLPSAAALAERLTALGCRFALDDFGVGFGSFYYLKRLPLHYVKIDGDFIQSLTRSSTDQTVTKAIVDVARGMGLKTIAEFVEDGETLELLRSYGVDYAQGFHIGRPAAIEA